MKYYCNKNIKMKYKQRDKNELSFTRGKEYKTFFKDTDESNPYYLVRDDNDNVFAIDMNLFEKHFVLLDGWRDNQLDELGIHD